MVEIENGNVSLGELWRKVKRGWRIRISELKNALKPDGERVWSATLTDAMMYAYQNHRVLKMTVDPEAKTFWCVIGDAEMERKSKQ